MRERAKVKINLIRVPFLHAVQTFLTTYTIIIKKTAREKARVQRVRFEYATERNYF